MREQVRVALDKDWLNDLDFQCSAAALDFRPVGVGDTLQEFGKIYRSEPRLRRSALASSFVAALELARTGKAELAQEETFGPLMLRRIAR